MRKLLPEIMVLLLVCLIPLKQANGQDHGNNDESEEHRHMVHKNAITFNAGYTYIPAGAELEHGGEADGFFVPTLGIDFQQRIKDGQWIWGVMLDWELDHYIIQKKELNRNKAFLIVPGLGYHLFRHTVIMGGAGLEFEENKNLPVFRLGIEQGFRISDRWVISPMFCWDIKEGYDTYALTLGMLLAL